MRTSVQINEIISDATKNFPAHTVRCLNMSHLFILQPNIFGKLNCKIKLQSHLDRLSATCVIREKHIYYFC